MILDLQTDHHIHTYLCNHASGEMEEYVLAGIEKNLKAVVFLEHLEAGINYFERTWLTRKDFAYYFEEGERLKRVYGDRIAIGLGVEVGFNPQAVPELHQRVSEFPWDYRGLSYHFYPSGDSHLNMVSRRRENIKALAAVGPDRVVTAYLDGLLQALREFDCDTLCHLDAVMRPPPGMDITVTHWKKIEEVLALVREKNMNLEVNTSGYGLRAEPYPSRAILDKALAMNISLVAGSDAHRPEQVGRYFDRLPGLISRQAAREASPPRSA